MALALPACRTGGTGLDGCLYWIDAAAQRWSDEQWKQEVGFMRAAGFRHVIVAGPAHEAAENTAGPVTAALDRFMAACRGSDMRVYLSLWAHAQWHARWNLDEEARTNERVIDRLAARYAEHPGFAGWYIPHEIYVTWDEPARYMADLYGRLSRLCKERTPGGIVVLSPFFILDRAGVLGDFRFAEPKEFEAYWLDLLRRTEIDVVALQDSGEHLSCYTMGDRRPFLAAMKRACDRAGKTMWVNVETGELDVQGLADYERRFGRKTHVNDARTQPYWRAVPPAKLRAKLQLAQEFADTTITWGYREYWDPLRGDGPRAVYAEYLHHALDSRDR